MHKALNKLVAVAAVVVIVAAAVIFLVPQLQPTTPSSTTTTTTISTTTTTSSTSTTVTTSPTTQKVLRIAIGIDADTLDPHAQTTTLISNIMSFITEPLFYYNEKGELIHYLAESYTVSSDGLKVTVVLKKGIKFQDGYPLNATAVKVTFDRLLNPKVKVPSRYLLDALNSTDIIDEYTVRFNLKYPYAPFVRTLTTWYVISPLAYQKLGEENLGKTPVDIGTGPFKFKEWVKGDRIVLSKFDGYWGGAVKFDEVVFKIVPEAQTREAMLLSGEVDIVYQPPPADLPKLNNTPGVVLAINPSTRVMTVNINTQRGPLKDVRVRQALNYAVDKEALIKNVLFNLATLADSPVYPAFFGYSPQKVYEYNPEKAKQLLAEAGYPNGFKLTLMVPTGRYIFDRQVGEALQAYLSKVGITVELYTPDWPTFVQSLIGQNYTSTPWDLCYVGYGMTTPDADAVLYSVFHSSQWAPGKFNTMFYKNERVDKLLDDARREVDEKKRLQMYAEAQAIIWEECPWIFLYFQNFVLAHSDKVHGLVVYPYETFDLRWVYIS
ncbi:MAG: ABC transporter substrate-binding protein [Nitrososphaeria archaeon]|nr:ABC transporter substrate-binding protein [Nitrososphaeria archaeon]